MAKKKCQEQNELGMTPMFNRIFIEEDKEFTLDEFAHLVARAVRSVAAVDIDKDEVKYSRDDVYFTIVDVIGYINERTPGRFKIDQTSFQSYLVHYVPPMTEKAKRNKGLQIQKANSAIHIKKMSGTYPVWAMQDESMMDLIAEIENAEAEKHGETPKHILENRASMAVKIFEMSGNMPKWVEDNPKLKEMVDVLLDEEGVEGQHPLLQSEGAENARD